MNDEHTNTALSVALLPNCGNKYFIGGCDTDIKLYDFETLQVLQIFPGQYGQYCDCVKFFDSSLLSSLGEGKEEGPEEYYFITRGVEPLNENGDCERHNACHLCKIVLPMEENGKFEIVRCAEFSNQE